MLKKSITIALVLSLLVSFSSLFTVNAFAVNDSYSINIPENDSNFTTASGVLEKYLKQITGKEPTDQGGIKFTLSYTTDVADNGYIIEIESDSVVINGNGQRGLIHGIYAFLEKYCGCKWYARDVISVPESSSLSFPSGEKTVYEPFFEYTDTDWYATDMEYSVANGLTGGTCRDIPAEYGGDVNYLGPSCHTLSTYFCSSEKYFEEHPEYFALNNGKRNSNQLCLTNEATYEIVLSEVMELLKNEHNPNESLQIVSLTQADNYDMCQCDNCKSIDNENGSHAGTMITFVNRIAKEVKAAGYNNVAIDTFAYQYTRKTPTAVEPDDNVIVRLCTIECCFAHALDDDSCQQNVALMEDLKNWGEICDRVYIWDYTTNYNHTVGIFPDFGVIQRNVQIFLENNVKGIYEEGNYYIATCDAEFGDLRSYLLSKLMQNPYIDFDAEMSGFNNEFYGSAGTYITEFIKMTMDNPCAEGGHVGIYYDMTDTLGFDKDDILKADELWKNAKNAVKDDAVLLERVERSELCWRYWKIFNPADVSSAKELAEDMKVFGIEKIQEGGERAAGPDDIVKYVAKANALECITVVYIVLYIVALILCLTIMIFAMKVNKKNWIYIVSFIVMLAYSGIFYWNNQVYIWWVASEVWISIGLIVLLFAFLGALAVRGKKKRIIGAITSAMVAFALYELTGPLVVNEIIFNHGAMELAPAVSFIFLAMFGILLESISLKNVLKEYYTAKQNI